MSSSCLDVVNTTVTTFGQSGFRFISSKTCLPSILGMFKSNKNKKYDSGNYLKKRQPERISHFEDKEDILNVRANWDPIIDFTLLD